MCEHQCAVDEHVQLHDDILCLSKVTATLKCARGILRITVADKWKPEKSQKVYCKCVSYIIKVLKLKVLIRTSIVITLLLWVQALTFQF